jgi:hypothetical protein
LGRFYDVPVGKFDVLPQTNKESEQNLNIRDKGKQLLFTLLIYLIGA